jgi:septin 7
VSIPRIS